MQLASKRGLGWPVENPDQVFIFTKPGSKVTWIYNWSPIPTPNAQSLNFIPMQWNHVDIDKLASRVLPSPAGSPYSATILAFNEPELLDQANMSVEQAAGEWLRVIEPLRRVGVRCGSPGISSAPEGVQWLQIFLARIRAQGGDIDFYCFHWYGETLGQFYDYIWSTHHQLGPDKPVWITEFAPTNWQLDTPLPREHVENFARESWKYLDSLDWIERYAWFGAMRNTGTVGHWARLIDDNGKLTPLGVAYRNE